MPLFVIIGYDTPNSLALRQTHRPAHLERLTALDEQKRLVLAGPTPIAHGESAMSGSIVVAEFDNRADAQAWADSDPYILGGVYSHIELRPFVKVFPQ